jgi:hypothetical protein
VAAQDGKAVTRLGIAGTRFTVNGRPTFLFGVSYYGALGAPDEAVRRDLADLKKHGFNWVRVWATWAAFGEDVSAVDGEGRPREPFLKRLERLVAACDEQGVVVDVTLSRGNGATGPARLQTLGAHRRAAETLVAALKAHRNWYLDLSNERNIKDKRFTSFADLQELRGLVRKLDPHRLVTASHAGDLSRDDLGEYLKTVQVDFLSPHRPRAAGTPGETEARSKEYLAWMKELGCEVPLHYQEPFRRDFGTWQPRAEDYVTDLKGALAGGAAGWCWHNGANRTAKDGRPRRSFDLREKRLFEQLDEEEARALPRLCEVIARAVQGAGKSAAGPLRVHPKNPRYFTDGTKNPDGSLRAVYLTGSHTWNNLVDMGRSDPPERFDFDAYLDFLERRGHNFIRLWAWDSTAWDTRANGGDLGKDFVHHVAPLPWPRTGPGKARDGKPKFDLAKFDPAYFERLRARVQAAGKRGIYVSVMLFEGWGLRHGNRGRAAPEGWAWRSHPFHPDNNVNGVDVGVGGGLSGEVHRLGNKKANALQAAYVRKVVDAVNDLDNVLYEVINEGGQKEWDWWVVKTVRDYERTRPKQHSIGLTGHGAERLKSLLESPADWVSPGSIDGFGDDPPAWDGKKVSLLDTDHVWGVGGNVPWVWKSFLRGHNPLFMDPYDGAVLGKPSDPRWEPVRRALGDARRLAVRVSLAAMAPRGELASTGYCLAQPGVEYLVYQPKRGEAFSVELKAGTYRYEWFNPTKGTAAGSGRVESSGGARRFQAPFDADAVLHLKAR